MRILIDLCHPAHVHFFKHSYKALINKNHELLLTARDKDCALDLLKALELPHQVLSTKHRSWAKMGTELVQRNRALYHVVKEFKPDIMAGIGGIFIAQVSLFTDIPSLVFYDGDNALAQNLLTYPFATKVIVPECYQGWTPKAKTLRYHGYHELSYMHPNYFTPNYEIAKSCGLKPNQKNYLIRLVSFKASHDIGHAGFDALSLEKIVQQLTALGNVIISSEEELPDGLKKYQYQAQPLDIHHLMAYCDGMFGESPTMAIESALVGVPALYVSSEQCGNIKEMEAQYQLVQQVNLKAGQALEGGVSWVLAQDKQTQGQRLRRLLEKTIDVTDLTCQLLTQPLDQIKTA